MEVSFNMALGLHVISGFAALLVFVIPMVTRKGGTFHRRTGWLYVVSMASVSITALYMGIYRLTWDAGSNPDAIPFSWFLIFIAILSGATAWYGIRVLRFKKRKISHRQPIDFLFPSLMLISAIGVSAYGWIISFPLLQYFPIIGMFLGLSQLQYWLSVPKRKSHWVVEHIVGMLSCCIATVTAFTVFGAPRLLQIESVSLMLWFMPTMALVPLIIGYSTYYTRKLDGKRNVPD
ncbi:hypothetical protein SAMN04488112_108173 [Melghirimyces thermohalophilus]|uniref:DUF2306 domain-containing protein n=1 Tax=Melghirimyces thermohalophilus TaxID=1236220 RepID=A0A1G6LZA3_9BACL|nr:DUF2306 domain-containing protein [Melghirimyces thermohalophilus]SDC48026.1 hypothetical protein SAMN04488112_108173 [Melghirimyces thermohalophilus]